jgi:beta-glucuronidase
MPTEYGAPSIAKAYTMEESEAYQANYHKAAWKDITCNSAGYGAGNAIGGIVFEWLDEWWKAYQPFYHDKKALFAGPFLDGYMHEEWLGLLSQGSGKHSPFERQLKKAYLMYKELWTNK